MCHFRIAINEKVGQYAIELSEKTKADQTNFSEKGEYDPYVHRDVEHPTT